MSKPSIDYSSLEKNLDKSAQKVYKLSDVEHKIRKVAFDIVRFIDGSDIEGLWKVEKTPQGECILALYDEDSMSKTASLKGGWAAVLSGQNDVNILYKNEPILRLASQDLNQLGIPKEEVGLLPTYLPEALANNKRLVIGLLSQLPESERKELYTKYPELA